MQTYSAYYRDDLPLDSDGLILVPDRFSWFALFLPVFWALRYQLWLVLLIYVLVSLLLQTVLGLLQAGLAFNVVVEIGFSLIFAYAAPFFRHRKLQLNGYLELAPVNAAKIEDAERVILENLPARVEQIKDDDYFSPQTEITTDQVNDNYN